MWVKLDDGFADHPKVVSAGPAAAWLFIAALCWVSKHLTDGRVPSAMVGRLTELKRPLDLARRLVEVGLWEETDGGFAIHDYLDWNPGAAKVKEKRAKVKERVERWRERTAGGVTNGVGNGVTEGVRNGAPVPSRPVPSDPPSGDLPARAPEPPRSGVEVRRRVSTGGAAFDAIREAFVGGVTSVTKAGYVLGPFAFTDLAAAVDGHAPKDLPLAELPAWVHAKAAAFARAAADGARIPSLKPKDFGEWLNLPQLAQPSRGRRRLPRQGLPAGADTAKVGALIAAGETDGNKLLEALGMK